MSLADDALTLFEDLAAENGKQVVYRAGSASLSLRMVQGRSRIEGQSSAGSTVIYDADDFLARASDLELSGVCFLPQKGHRIEAYDAAESRNRVFEVLPPAPGMEVYDHVDPNRVLLRIFCKEIRQTQTLP